MRGIINRLVNIRNNEGRAVFWSFCYFFTLLSSYYTLRPIRDEMGILVGVEQLQWLFTGTFIAMLTVVPLFGWITSRFSRSQFLPIIYIFFISNILIFYMLFNTASSAITIARSFFIWVSVFNLFIVSVFWSFMTDIYQDEQSKRLFGFIASGGTLGAIAGPALTALLVQKIGTHNLLLVSAALLSTSLICIKQLIVWKNQESRNGLQQTPSEIEPRPLGGGLFDGISLLTKSPYLLGICALIIFYASLSTFLYLQQAQIIKEAFDDSDTRTAVFAGLDFAVNTLTLLIQTLVTGRLIAWLGVGKALALIPLLLSIGFVLLGLAPTLWILIIVQVLRRSGNYAIMRPAREMLYVVVSREEKYKAKNFIDTVVYRGGDAASSWVYTGFRGLGLSMSTIAWIAVPLALLWAWIGLWLGKKHAQLENLVTKESGDGDHE